MDVLSDDSKVFVDVGSADIWNTLHVNIEVIMKKEKTNIKHAMKFMKDGGCSYKDANKVLQEFQLIKESLMKIPIDQIVYQKKDKTAQVPWLENASPELLCVYDAFITADGKMLIDEIIHILEYSYQNAIGISCPEM